MTGTADYVVVDRLGKTFNPGTRQQVDAERRKTGGEQPYLGANDQLIDAAIARAEGKSC